MLIDIRRSAGARADKRLKEEAIAWLTTVTPQGHPQSSPIWYLWDGKTILLYSQKDKGKLKNIATNPNVSFHLDSDGVGGDILAIEGRAAIEPGAPPANQLPTYLEKYRDGIKRIGMTPDSFASDYSEAVRITPERARYW